ncbi:arabinogalactan endo-1,4-beta-galactosidase [Fomes fomentarius]|nr:arabinogalactan endo-1,4-beta-galactosidase [Fomes fomentarius]
MVVLLPLLFLSLSALVQALTYKAADISSIVVVENAGHRYTDSGKVTPFETIIKNHGANTARIRVWTAGQYDLNYGLALAKRIKAAGLTLVIDLHYSDTWADPGHQAIPSGWPTDLDGLNTKIWQYTQDVVKAFSNQGTPIDILQAVTLRCTLAMHPRANDCPVQVGNEINDGLLWPVGRISVNGINPVSQLLNSAINGAKSVASPKILIHLANAWDWSDISWFFKNVYIQGALSADKVDIIGLSFYPFYDSRATLSTLTSSLTNTANTFGKPIVIAETNWPVSCAGGSLSEKSIPISSAGQSSWVWNIEQVLNGLPNGLGQGIFYWEPGWIGNANLGSACADNLLVESSGATRDSINIFTWDM